MDERHSSTPAISENLDRDIADLERRLRRAVSGRLSSPVYDALRDDHDRVDAGLRRRESDAGTRRMNASLLAESLRWRHGQRDEHLRALDAAAAAGAAADEASKVSRRLWSLFSAATGNYCNQHRQPSATKPRHRIVARTVRIIRRAHGSRRTPRRRVARKAAASSTADPGGDGPPRPAHLRPGGAP